MAKTWGPRRQREVPIQSPSAYYARRAENAKVITRAYIDEGLSARDIAAQYNIPLNIVKTCITQLSLKQLAAKEKDKIVGEVLKGKLPILREIAGLTLITVRNFMEDLNSDPAKKAALNIGDIKQLASIAKDMNELARLEEGKSTQNVHAVHEVAFKVEKDVTVLLEELKVHDPFVEYPAIGHDEQSTIEVGPNGAKQVCPNSNGSTFTPEDSGEIPPRRAVPAT